MSGHSISSFIKIARGVGVAAIIVIYALLVHHVNTLIQSNITQFNVNGFGVIQTSTLGAILALAPLFLLVITYAFNATSRLIGIGSLLIFCVIAWILWPFIKQHTGLIFWLLDVGLILALLITFAQTLIGDRKPLCVHFAEIINGGQLPADHESYARKVTIAWVVFFALIIVISTLLFFFASLSIWSFFVNFLTLPLVALMFAGEFFVRKRLLTDLPTGNVMDAVHAYLDKSTSAR
ncbi:MULTISPECIES: hypothetical protein [Methylotenera]|uniref:COG4648 family protein n=1 Tax=Methylotenera TaxID=359407 RepID=UPI0003642A3E|nr:MULTISPECIES: hypothetical protein [Methylotenera]